MNSGVLGLPNVELGLGVSPDDGQVDVYAVPAENLADSIAQAWHLIAGSDEEDSGIRHATARRSISIRSEEAMPFQADGEPLGETPASEAIDIEVVPAAVPIVVPPEAH
jgi:diacylglycerol kinase family enzyme